MPDVRSPSLACLSKSGFHRVAYREFAPQGTVPEHPRTDVCLHGLDRNARAFEAMTATIAAGARRDIPVSTAGRGDSVWPTAPHAYVYPQYAPDKSQSISRHSYH